MKIALSTIGGTAHAHVRDYERRCLHGLEVYSEEGVDQAQRDGERAEAAEIEFLFTTARTETVIVSDAPHELFRFFIEQRRGAKIMHNSCEGNADLLYERDGVFVELCTDQDNHGVTLKLSSFRSSENV